MNSEDYKIVTDLTALTLRVKDRLEKYEVALPIANKILELDEEEYTVHKDKSWSVNGEEIASLGLTLAKLILK